MALQPNKQMTPKITMLKPSFNACLFISFRLLINTTDTYVQSQLVIARIEGVREQSGEHRNYLFFLQLVPQQNQKRPNGCQDVN